MSVAIIDREELAEVARLAVAGAPDEVRRMSNCEAAILVILARFSEANVAAYRRQYVEGRATVDIADLAIRPVAAEQIVELVRERRAPTGRHWGPILYNAYDNEGWTPLDETTRKAVEAVEAWAKVGQTAIDAAKRRAELPPSVEYSPHDRRHYGKKYDRSLDVVEIAKRVRADIKQAVNVGALPRGKYSVRIDRYSMGRSIDVTLSDLDGVTVYRDEYVAHHVAKPHAVYDGKRYTDRLADAIKVCESILVAYNYDGSDSMTDHYDVNFAAHVRVDWQWEARIRDMQIAALESFAEVAR